MALGRIFTIAAGFTDPDTYFVGGGVVEADPKFRDWFLAKVHEHTVLRAEQVRVADFALVPDLDRAGGPGRRDRRAPRGRRPHMTPRAVDPHIDTAGGERA